MANLKDKPVSAESVERLVFLMENIFILESLKAGINVEDIRKLLKIDKWKIINVSKILKAAKSRKG